MCICLCVYVYISRPQACTKNVSTWISHAHALGHQILRYITRMCTIPISPVPTDCNANMYTYTRICTHITSAHRGTVCGGSHGLALLHGQMAAAHRALYSARGPCAGDDGVRHALCAPPRCRSGAGCDADVLCVTPCVMVISYMVWVTTW